jgi:hypothetical protein
MKWLRDHWELVIFRFKRWQVDRKNRKRKVYKHIYPHW